MYQWRQKSKIKIAVENRDGRIERALAAVTKSAASRRLRLLNKSVLFPGVHDTDDEGEGDEGGPVGKGQDGDSTLVEIPRGGECIPPLSPLTKADKKERKASASCNSRVYTLYLRSTTRPSIHRFLAFRANFFRWKAAACCVFCTFHLRLSRLVTFSFSN